MKVWCLIVAVFTLSAQTESPKPAMNRVIGEVTAEESSGKQLTVKSDAGPSYTITSDEKTLFLRVPPGEKDLKKATKISADDVKVGDRVMARGPVAEEQKTVAAVSVIVMTKEDLAAKQKREQAEWQRGVSGEVKSISPDGKEVVVASRAREGVTSLTTVVVGPNTTIRRYSPDSLRFADAKPAAVTEIQPGDQARVLGQKNADGTRVGAESVIFGTFRTIAGTVISVDAASNEIKLKDLETKQPVTIKVTANSQLRKLPPMVANILARRLNPTYQAAVGAAGGAGGSGFRPNGEQGGMARGGSGSMAGGGAGPGAGVRDAGQRGGPGSQAGGPGSGPGDRPRMGGAPNMERMLEMAPTFTLAEIQPGEALIVSTTARAGDGVANAITVLSGVEPILRAAPTGAGVNLGGWSLEMNVPMQ
jgi:hypothetical protein